jgi:hypothetical protein
MVSQRKSRCHMHIPFPGMERNSGSYLWRIDFCFEEPTKKSEDPEDGGVFKPGSRGGKSMTQKTGLESRRGINTTGVEVVVPGFPVSGLGPGVVAGQGRAAGRRRRGGGPGWGHGRGRRGAAAATAGWCLGEAGATGRRLADRGQRRAAAIRTGEEGMSFAMLRSGCCPHGKAG